MVQVSETPGVPVSILAIGAHPDDIELGCGATLAKLARSGAAIRVVIFSKGRRGALSDADRAKETRIALSTLGVDDVVVYDFEDTRLSCHLNEMIALLDEHVKAFRPHRAYTMFQHDRHQDHRAVYEASAIACRTVPQFLGYETPSSYPHFMPTVFEPIDQYLESKVNALKCHASQGDRLYMQEEKIRSAANFRGAQADLGPSEAFIPYRMIL
ncbi:PIG-L deacetylase family protein [Tsuneonella sp. HG222]